MLHPRTLAALAEQVVDRTRDYHRRFPPGRFVAENKREWEELCVKLAARAAGAKPIFRYPFADSEATLLEMDNQELYRLDTDTASPNPLWDG